jgi:hypothetical protein
MRLDISLRESLASHPVRAPRSILGRGAATAWTRRTHRHQASPLSGQQGKPGRGKSIYASHPYAYSPYLWQAFGHVPHVPSRFSGVKMLSTHARASNVGWEKGARSMGSVARPVGRTPQCLYQNARGCMNGHTARHRAHIQVAEGR